MRCGPRCDGVRPSDGDGDVIVTVIVTVIAYGDKGSVVIFVLFIVCFSIQLTFFYRWCVSFLLFFLFIMISFFFFYIGARGQINVLITKAWL